MLSPQNFPFGSVPVDISQYPLAVRLALIDIQKLSSQKYPEIVHTKMDKESIVLLYKTI